MFTFRNYAGTAAVGVENWKWRRIDCRQTRDGKGEEGGEVTVLFCDWSL